MGATLDLDKAYQTRNIGDLLVVYTWVNDERAMVLLPAFRKNAAWYIVCESAAFKYDNPHYLANQCRKAAEVLGMESSPNNWYKLARVIHEGLPDLIEMPSAPDAVLSRASIGEIKLLENGKLVAGTEIRPELAGGVTYGQG